jgi:hypothetical protein
MVRKNPKRNPVRSPTYKARIRDVFKIINKKCKLSGHEWTEHGPTTGYDIVGPFGVIAHAKTQKKAEQLQQEWQAYYDKFYNPRTKTKRNPDPRSNLGLVALKAAGLNAPVPRTKPNAKLFLRKLAQSPFAFHLDDPTDDIPTFSPGVAKWLDARRNASLKVLGIGPAWKFYANELAKVLKMPKTPRRSL